MAIRGKDGADLMIQMLQEHVSYQEADCIEAAVRRPIRKCPGGDPSYKIGGCTQLWNSYEKTGKYHDVTERMTIAEWKASGKQLVGDLLVIYDAGSAVCEHVAYYLGGYRGYEAIHSSQSRGGVFETHVKNGFTHVLRHRLIAGEPVNGERKEDEPVSALYKATVATQKGALNLRTGPGTNYQKIGSLAKGTVVDVLAEPSNGWSYVSSGTLTGYASSEYLERQADPEPAPVPAPDPDQDADPDLDPGIVTTTISNGEGVYVSLLGRWTVVLD